MQSEGREDRVKEESKGIKKKKLTVKKKEIN